MLASLRGDRIIALDANPDRGTLSDKVRLETAATVRDLLNERDQIQRYADVRAFTSQAPSRLEVLASDRDPAVSVAFSEEDYYDAARVLEHYYSISLTDCGTGLLHSAMSGVLRMADQIVLVSSPSVDGARSASATLDWLDAHEYGDLVRNAVVVLSMVRQRSKSSVDLDRLEQHFASRCRAVARIPYDVHLEEGAEVDLEQMSPATVNAYLVLAATVGDGFAWPRRAARQPVLGACPARRAAGNGYRPALSLSTGSRSVTEALDRAVLRDLADRQAAEALRHFAVNAAGGTAVSRGPVMLIASAMPVVSAYHNAALRIDPDGGPGGRPGRGACFRRGARPRHRGVGPGCWVRLGRSGSCGVGRWPALSLDGSGDGDRCRACGGCRARRRDAGAGQRHCGRCCLCGDSPRAVR